jgi:ferredoxin-NADP reductase
MASGAVDAKRLPKAVQAILSHYRGRKVSGIPEEAIPAVLARLARAARQAGHMPPEACNPAPIYRQLAEALEQLGVTADATGAP